MSHDPQPLGGKIISKPVMIFGPLIVICMLLIVKRLVFGLGSVSDLNGGFPWGVWIAFDLLIGTGFACGGWALAWAVYVFNRGNTIRWCVRRCWRVCLVTHWGLVDHYRRGSLLEPAVLLHSGSLQRELGTVRDGGLYDHLYRRDGTGVCSGTV